MSLLHRCRDGLDFEGGIFLTVLVFITFLFHRLEALRKRLNTFQRVLNYLNLHGATGQSHDIHDIHDPSHGRDEQGQPGSAALGQGMSSLLCPRFRRHLKGANPSSHILGPGLNGIISPLSRLKGSRTLTHSQYGQRSLKRTSTLRKIASGHSLGFVSSGFKAVAIIWSHLPCKSHKRQKMP